jgi:hypothetical protein
MNAAEALARQIRRVAVLRGAAQQDQQGETGCGIPLEEIEILDAALEIGCKAAGMDDAVAQMAVAQRLAGFEK